MNCTQLAGAFERGEINFEEFMTTNTDPEKFVVKPSKKRGRRAAAEQGALVTASRVELANQTFQELYGSPKQQPLSDEQGPFVPAPGNLKTAETALRFIMAGNAYFTVRSLKAGTRYTFRVNKADCSRCGKKDCKCWAFPTYFVALLSGPDNTADYTYMGMVRENLFRLTRASKFNDQSIPVKAFRWVFEHLVRGELPPQTEIWHEGRCGVCGRPLTVPESIEAGIGPVCAEGGM